MFNSIISLVTAFVISILSVLGLHGGVEQPPVDTPVKEMTVSFANDREFFEYIDNFDNLLSEGNKENGYTYSVYKDSFAIIENTNVHSEKMTLPTSLGGYRVIAANGFGFSLTVKEVVIPEGIDFVIAPLTSLKSLEKVTLPSTIKYLRAGTFDRCRKLTELVIPESLDCIPAHLCVECTNLKTVKMGSKVTEIDGFAFAWCKSLENIVLPETVERIQTQAFDGCVSLKTINLPDNLEVIGFGAFRDCKNLEIDRLPDNLKVIGTIAFQNCKSLKELYIPESVTSIDNRAFWGCPNLVIVSSSDYVIEFAKANNIPYKAV
ncbi:MAG: leucine-rich repeat domain-containing protein [Clostridia bacterium]|nr:leucine-rich repeat domain-containing protein [Clostridia bacterium]